MRSVIQRVARASVSVDGEVKSSIGSGILVLLGVEEEDTQKDVDWLAAKISRLRIFDDTDGVMNLSVVDVGGEVLVISQFTLYGSVRKGNRPSYNRAAGPKIAVPLYQAFVQAMNRETGKKAGTGEFGARMKVALVNDGPVTIVIDTRNVD